MSERLTDERLRALNALAELIRDGHADNWKALHAAGKAITDLLTELAEVKATIGTILDAIDLLPGDVRSDPAMDTVNAIVLRLKSNHPDDR